MIASAVILAAGRGDRMQIDGNKILMPISGQPLICWTVSAFTEIPDIEDLVLVVHANEMEAVKKLIQPIAPHIRIVEGGPTRRDSAVAGVRAARGDIVLIHDGARPFPTRALIHSVLAEAERAKAAIPVLPVTDLLHHHELGRTITTPPSLDIPRLSRQSRASTRISRSRSQKIFLWPSPLQRFLNLKQEHSRVVRSSASG